MEAQHQHRSRIQHQQKNKPEETKKNQNKTLFAFYQNDTLDIKKEMNKIKISVSLPRKQDSFRTPWYRYRYFQREWRKILSKKWHIRQCALRLITWRFRHSLHLPLMWVKGKTHQKPPSLIQFSKEIGRRDSLSQWGGNKRNVENKKKERKK